MDKATKYYKEALTKYHNGYIDQAINLCAASVAENNKYKAAASLKGVLFYFKGDLENARELWEFNVRVNKDVVSKKYLDNSKIDDKFLPIYAKGVGLINEVKISEALECLKECEESDFNVINVSNHIALCYIKQGEFSKARVYLDKVIVIDKKNKMAMDNIKMLKKYGIIENKFKHVPIIACLIILIIIGTSLSTHFFKRKTVAIQPKVEVVKPVVKTEPTTKEEVKPAQTFPYDKLKAYIDQGNYDELDKQLNLWKDKNVDDKAKALLQTASVLVKDKGLKAFYDKAGQYSTAKDYKNAFIYYYKIYSYGKVNYLYENGLFFLGKTKEKLGDAEEAIKYYEEYNTDFPKGEYAASVLYTLVNLYSKKDTDKSKTFAKILIKRFPNSDYNNTFIKKLAAS